MNKTRPKQLSFRVSEEEYRQLQEKILESGKNQQEYILSCVLEKQIVNTDGMVLPPSHYEPFGSLKRGIEGGLATLTSSKVVTL